MSTPEDVKWENFRRNVALARGQKSQAEFAKELGVYQQNLSRYEAGDRKPSGDILLQMATSLGVTIDELFGDQERFAVALKNVKPMWTMSATVPAVVKEEPGTYGGAVVSGTDDELLAAMENLIGQARKAPRVLKLILANNIRSLANAFAHRTEQEDQDERRRRGD